MRDPFWPTNNAWWKSAVQFIGNGVAAAEIWEEADRRLWCLSRRFLEGEKLQAQDRQDLVQTILLQLHEPQLLKRLLQIEAPAHYLCEMMKNHLRTQRKRESIASGVFKAHAELVARGQDERPDELAAWNEWCAKARFIVQHVVSLKDRQVLTWYYYEGLTASQVGERLSISEAAALQQIARARVRVKREFTE